MATVYKKRYDCPFKDGVCGGEHCRCWDNAARDCGMKIDNATLGDMFTAVADIGDKLGELARLFREIVVLADDEPTERTRTID